MTLGTSWTHRLARMVVRPLIGTGITPNHLTTLRLITGLAACAALLPGEPRATLWAGWFWLLSAFLDRADGELARIGNMTTPGGHRYDYIVDTAVNALFFAAAGVGLRHSWLGGAAIPLGLVAGLSLYVCGVWSELLEQRLGTGEKAYSGAFGFDPDDALYLLAPAAWFGLLAPLVLGAAIGASFMMALTGLRLRRLGSRGAAAEKA